MMGSYVLPPAALVGGMMLAGMLCHTLAPDSEIEMILEVCGVVSTVACGVLFLGMQFMAAMYCRQCPETVVRRGKTWIFASGVFYGMFFLAILIVPLLPPYGWCDDLITLLGWIAVWCFGISAWFWQIFLIGLARGIKSNAGPAVGCWTISLFTVAGFGAMFYNGVHDFISTVAYISGLGFLGLYPILLAGLWWRIGENVAAGEKP